MKLISLFSGIGGFELAAEWMGWTPVVSCEINPFGRKVLEHYWPQAYHHTDIKKLTYEKINQELTKRFGAEWRSDDIILTGGFPCQPYSMAGKRLGKEDDRHLWPEMLRVIREVQPTWIVGENVFGLVNWNGGLVFDEVQTDLEAQGYEVQPYVLPACAVNAPHRRDRVWFVAYAKLHANRLPTTGRVDMERTILAGQERSKTTNGLDIICQDATHPNGNGLNGSDCEHEVNPSQGGEYALSNSESLHIEQPTTKHTNGIGQKWRLHENKSKTAIGKQFSKRNARSIESKNWHNFPTQSPICGGDDGLPAELDGITFSKWRNESIKAYGNAIVPQVALQIFKAIQAYQK